MCQEAAHALCNARRRPAAPAAPAAPGPSHQNPQLQTLLPGRRCCHAPGAASALLSTGKRYAGAIRRRGALCPKTAKLSTGPQCVLAWPLSARPYNLSISWNTVLSRPRKAYPAPAAAPLLNEPLNHLEQLLRVCSVDCLCETECAASEAAFGYRF